MTRAAASPGTAVGAESLVASPCTSVCRMDARTGRCEGCARTLGEITAWSTMSDGEKRAVWALLDARQRPSAT